MGRRSRRSASNVISAAILEVFIMGLFVIIAQPQLRDALMGILHVDRGPAATASNSPVTALSVPGLPVPGPSTLHTAHYDAQSNKSVLPQLNHNSISSDSPTTLGTVSNLAGMAASALQGLANATAPAGAAMNPTNNDSRIAPPANAYSNNAPLEHYESFRVSVPGAQQAEFDYRQALPSTSNRNNYAYQELSSPGMVPLGPSHSIAPFASGPNVNRAPTQLVPGQWNIASANQSPLPSGGWNVVRPHETSYQEPYPPPYGTQSQWK